jgi:DNA-binding transcriptional LysR family regulator
MLGAFQAAHPELEVELAIGTTAEVAEQVLAERAPFGLVEAPVTLHGLEVRPIGEDELVLVSSPGHNLVGTSSIAARDLETVPLLRRESGSGTQALIDTALWRLGVTMPTAMVLGSSEALKQAALAGIAVAWLPLSAVARELDAGDLVAVAVPEVRVRRTLSLILPAGSTLTAAGRALLDAFKHSLEAPRGADQGRPISTSRTGGAHGTAAT